MRMPLNCLKRELRCTGMPHPADDAAMAARRDVTARTRVRFLHVPRGKNLFVENRYRSDKVSAVFVHPNPRCDVVHGVDDVSIPVADVRSFSPTTSFCVTTRGKSAIEIKVRFRRKKTTDAFVGNAKAVDLFEETRCIGKERHAAKLRWRVLLRAVHLPRLAVGL